MRVCGGSCGGADMLGVGALSVTNLGEGGTQNCSDVGRERSPFSPHSRIWNYGTRHILPLRRTRGTVASVVPGISLRIRSRQLAPGTVDQRLSSECVGVARVEKYAITMYWTVYVNYDGPWLPTSVGGDSWLFRLYVR